MAHAIMVTDKAPRSSVGNLNTRRANGIDLVPKLAGLDPGRKDISI